METDATQALNFVYGTAWKEDDTERCVLDALRAGFRAIDTANQRRHYYEEGVGAAFAKAIDEGIVRRKDLFIQSKFTFLAGQDHRLPYDPNAQLSEQVMQSFHSSLGHLGVDYLDSYVLHGPSTRPGLSDADFEVWAAMEELFRAGRVKALGVSNVLPDQLKLFLDHASIKPHFVQNRCFARLHWDREVRTYCKQSNIRYQGFSLLTANSEVWHSPICAGIAERHGVTPAQIIFRFCQQLGILPLTGTSDRTHMEQDLASSSVCLSDDELTSLEHSNIS